MATLTSPTREFQWLIMETPAMHCREEVTLLNVASTVLASGRVLGKVTASGKYVLLNPAAVDGSEVAAGILLHETDVSAADVQAAIFRRGPLDVRSADLDWGSMTTGEIATAVGELETLGIIAR